METVASFYLHLGTSWYLDYAPEVRTHLPLVLFQFHNILTKFNYVSFKIDSMFLICGSVICNTQRP
jgi:hypothetical protein